MTENVYFCTRKLSAFGMKKIIPFIIVLLIGAWFGIRWWDSEHTQVEDIPALVKETAVISCDQPTRQFGTIREADGVVEHTFTVSNSGTAPLVLVNCDGGCGCITAEWTRQPIAPGSTGTVHVMYNPEGVKGIFMKTIQVISNASNNPLNLMVRGEVE